MVKWTKQWRGENATQLISQVGKIVSELESMGPVLAAQVVEAEAKAEAQRRQWEEEERLRRQEQERIRKLKVREEAKAELLAAIEAWSRTQRVEEWLASVERGAQGLTGSEREHVLGRLEAARTLIGGADALGLLKKWKSPEERS